MNAGPGAKPHVVIVGGGITGLSAAHRLLASSGGRLDVTVLEASDRFGGKIRTVRRDGLILDGGPDAFVDTKPQAAALAREVGIGDRLIETRPENRRVYFLRDGKAFHLPEGLVLAVPTRFWPLMQSPLFSLPGLARMGLDLVLPGRRSEGDESIASFLRRRLGPEAVEMLGGPLLGGIYAGDPERLSIDATFPQLRDLERRHGSLVRGALAARAKAPARSGPPPSPFRSFKSGMADLPEAVVARIRDLGGTLRLGAAVDRVALDGKSARVWTHTDGTGTELTADHLILALPAAQVARLVDGIDEGAARLLRGIPHVSSATCLMAFERSAIAHPLDGVGMLLPKSEGRQAIALTFVTSKWPGRAPDDVAVMRVFFGGYSRPEVRGLLDADITLLAREELREILGITATPTTSEVFRWNDANPQPIVGHADRIEAIRRALSAHAALSIAGAAFDGVGIPDCIRQGEEAAQVALGRLLAPPAG